MSETTTGTQCEVQGGLLACPAGGSVSLNDVVTEIDATLLCPLDTVDQSNFVRASQLGLCSCNTAIKGKAPDAPDEPIDCECYACPEGSRLGFAFQCSTEIVGRCFNFSCPGDCNGDLANVDKPTFPPSMAPTDSGAGMATMVGGYNMVIPAMIFCYLMSKALR